MNADSPIFPWPGASYLRRIFPPAIPHLYRRCKDEIKVTGFEASPQGISATVNGEAQCTLTHTEEKPQWRFSCNCTSAGKRSLCLHTFTLIQHADKLLKKIKPARPKKTPEEKLEEEKNNAEKEAKAKEKKNAARKKNNEKDASDSDKKAKAEPKLKKKTTKAEKAKEKDTKKKTTKAEKTKAENKNEQPPQVPIEPPPLEKLTCEAEPHYDPVHTGVRFYLQGEDNMRRIISIQELYNLCSRAQKKAEGMYPQDADFLRWLFQFINKKHIYTMKSNVLPIVHTEFRRWVDTWSEVPGRFIDRQTQEPVLSEEASLRCFLNAERRGKILALSCQIGITAKNCAPLNELIPYFREGGQIEYQGNVLPLPPQLPLKKLIKLFSNAKNPAIPLAQAADFLPVICEDFFDLWQPGEALRFADTARYCKLKVRCSDLEISAEVMPPPHVEKANDGSLMVRLPRRWREVRRMLADCGFQWTRPGCHTMTTSREGVAKLHEIVQKLDKRNCDIDGSLKSFFKPLKIEQAFDLHESDVDSASITLRWSAGDHEFKADDIQAALNNKTPYLCDSRGQWTFVNLEHLQNHAASGLNSFSRNINLRMPKVQAQAFLAAQEESDIGIPLHQRAKGFLSNLKSRMPKFKMPDEVKDILRHYQHDGVKFLHERTILGSGALLADEMGLGKTLQTLSAVCWRKEKTLVICPASVISVWAKEAEKFFPNTNVSCLSGTPSQRKKILDEYDHGLLVTSYQGARIEADSLFTIQFDTLVADEAQMLKNPDAKTTKAVKSLRSKRRIALTGTPVENRVEDFWSIFDFLNPGLLGDIDCFLNNWYAGPAAREQSLMKSSAFMLRRRKREVAAELPEKTIEDIMLPQTDVQRIMSKQLLEDAKQAESTMGLFGCLTRLRQLCCAPQLCTDIISDGESLSPKIEWLMDTLEEIRENGHSCLIFSQFTSLLDIVEEKLEKRLKVKPYIITGSTPIKKRAALVDDFQESEDPEVFLLSLKAAGSGITLHKADYVFILDPWWNPASEHQAIDRAHRIGQKNPVNVYRLFMQDSIEEKVRMLQQEKQALFDEIVENDDVSDTSRLSADDLRKLLFNP